MKIPAEGATERAAAAAKIIGTAAAAQRDIEHAQRMQERLQSIAAQKELAEFEYRLQIDRAKFNAAMGFEEEKRARLWDIEKMELRSRIDFEKAEKARTQEEAEYEAGVKIINESHMTDAQKADALYKLEIKHVAGYVPSVPREREEDPIKALVRQKIQQMATPSGLGGVGVMGTPGMRLGQQVTAPAQPVQYQLGQTVSRGGRNYKVVGFDSDGEPLVNPI